jgi:hypothetical protein
MRCFLTARDYSRPRTLSGREKSAAQGFDGTSTQTCNRSADTPHESHATTGSAEFEMTTAHGRLHAATLELTKSSAMKQRLTNAFSIFLKELDADELPTEMRPDFAALVAELESVRPLPGETAVQATVRKMSPEQAERLAARIVEIYGDLLRAPSSVTKLHPRDDKREKPEGAAVVPLLFAAEA